MHTKKESKFQRIHVSLFRPHLSSGHSDVSFLLLRYSCSFSVCSPQTWQLAQAVQHTCAAMLGSADSCTCWRHFTCLTVTLSWIKVDTCISWPLKNEVVKRPRQIRKTLVSIHSWTARTGEGLRPQMDFYGLSRKCMYFRKCVRFYNLFTNSVSVMEPAKSGKAF